MIWKAVVIRGDATHLSDGDTLSITPLADRELTPGRLVDRAARLFVGEGTVVWWPQLQPDTHPVRARKNSGAAIVASIREHGWNISDRGIETGWFTATKAGHADVHLGIGQWIDQRKTPVVQLEEAPGLVAMQLAMYHRATGAAWRMSAGMAGSAGIRNDYSRRRPSSRNKASQRTPTGQPLWRWDAAPADVIGCSWEPRWARELTPAERHYPLVHQFDITGAYLAAAANSRLAWSAPRHTGPTLFEPTAAGYWLVKYGPRSVDVSKARMAGGEMILPSARIRPDDDMMWLTTPVMSWLEQHNIRPEIHDAWVADRSGTYLRSWSERIRDARWNPDYATLLPAIKQTYTRTVGTLGKPGGRVYRPDWRDTIVDLARINLRRKIDAAAEILGVLPVRVNIDSVYYADDDPDATLLRQALAVEPDRLGKFRHVRSYTMQEWHDRATSRHG